MNSASEDRNHRRRGGRALVAALQSALQWRVLLLWVLATLVPTKLATLPLVVWLQSQFGDSIYAADIAAGRNVPLLFQGLGKLGDQMGAISTTVLAATIMMLLLSPWLTGMVVASLRARRRLGFGELVYGGLGEYWRMLRMLLWSAIPVGIAIAIGVGLMSAASKGTEDAILSSEVTNASRLAMLVAGIVFVLAHAGVEAGRGWLGADPGLRSVVRAWWRGCKLVFTRPVATLGVYLGSCIVGFGLALLLALLRLRIDGVGIGAFVLSLLLAQAIVAVLAWGRIVRLYGLADLAADAIARRIGSGRTDYGYAVKPIHSA